MLKTLELNGLVKRMNRTVMERVQSMVTQAKLSKTFWAEVLMAMAYVINRSTSNPLDGDIP